MKTLLLAFVLASQTGFGTTIEIEPSTSVAGLGQTFSLDVAITDVADLFSYQFDVSYDPAVLSANSITEGPFLGTGGATFFIPGSIDNVAGSISFTANSLLGLVPGVTGSGTLATVSFNALLLGTSPVDLSGVILLDSQFRDIPTEIRNGTVDVVVPEPATVLLVGAALLALGLKRWREKA